MKPKLIFVYNADTGFFNGLSDFAHKILSPKTYSCNLCRITYGTTSMKKEWKSFVESLDTEVEFLHRDEFQKVYSTNKEKLPAVFNKTESTIEMVISSKKLNELSDVESLINEVKNIYSSKI